jgi:hypothetical protein
MSIYEVHTFQVTETTALNVGERKVTTKLRGTDTEDGHSTTYDVTISRSQPTSGGTVPVSSPFDPTKVYRVEISEWVD